MLDTTTKRPINMLSLSNQLKIVEFLKQESVLTIVGERQCRYVRGWTDAAVAEAVSRATGTTVTTANVNHVRNEVYGGIVTAKGDRVGKAAPNAVATLRAEIHEITDRHSQELQRLRAELESLKTALGA